MLNLLLGQGKNFAELPILQGIKHNRAALSWQSKPWMCQIRNDTIERYEVRSGDRGYPADAGNGNERSELVTTDQAAQNLLFDFGEEFWLSQWFRVLSGGPITSQFHIVGQYHDWDDPGDTIGLSPPLCFVLGTTSNNVVQWTIQTRFDKNPVTSVQPSATTRYSMNMNRDQWYRIAVRGRFSVQDAGELQCWIDGTEVLNLTGINMGFAHSQGGPAAYYQRGIYRKEDANTTAVEYARVEQSKSSLLARVSSPLTFPGAPAVVSVPGGVPSGDTPPPPAAGMVLNYQTDFVSTANKRSGGTMQSVPFVISPNSASPPANAWLSCFPYGRIVNNNEAGLYADPTIMTGVDPFPIVSGVRTLQSGPITNGNGYIEINGLRYRYYASLITSRWAFTVTDGDYVEVDFSCPGVFGNKGQWPAFWLLKAAALGANNEWPPEIDVLEWPQVIDAAGGSKIDEYWSNQHRVSAGALPDTINFPAKGLTGNVEGRHRYGIRITSANIQLYVDDTLVRTMTNYAPGIEWYVILNLALGGDWPNGFNAYPQSPAGSNTYPNGTPPTPNGQTTFPGTMKLYNVRHYKPS